MIKKYQEFIVETKNNHLKYFSKLLEEYGKYILEETYKELAFFHELKYYLVKNDFKKDLSIEVLDQPLYFTVKDSVKAKESYDILASKIFKWVLIQKGKMIYDKGKSNFLFVKDKLDKLTLVKENIYDFTYHYINSKGEKVIYLKKHPEEPKGLKKDYFYVSRKYIWSFFSNKSGYNYTSTQVLIKSRAEQLGICRGITPLISVNDRISMAEQLGICRGITPVVSYMT